MGFNESNGESRRPTARRTALVVFAWFAAFLVIASWRGRSTASSEVPTVWDDAAMREVELPLAAHIPVHHMPAD
jgi:hypothetical protein